MNGLNEMAAIIRQQRDALLSSWRQQVKQLPSARNLDTPTLNAGFSKDKLEKVFDELESDSANGNGLGLGLAIIKRFIEAHGGRVSIESRKGMGSKFRFTLPMKAEREQLATRSIAAAHAVPAIRVYGDAGKVIKNARTEG